MPPTSQHSFRLFTALSLTTALEGFIATFFIFRVPSLEASTGWFGFSASRLALGAGAIFLSILFFALGIILARQPAWLQRAAARFESLLASRETLLAIFSIGLFGLIVCGGIILAFSTSLTADLISTPLIYQRISPFFFWGFAAFLQSVIAFSIQFRTELFKQTPVSVWKALRPLAWLIFAATVVFVLTDHFAHLNISKEIGFHYLAFLSALALFLALSYIKEEYRDQAWAKKVCELCGAGLVFVSAYFLYVSTAESVNYMHTPSKAYFNHLAEAFLQGRLYLESPDSTMDLTLFNGQWYVAFPPLAAILMLPGVALYGANGISTVVFTIFFASISVMLVYLILNELSDLAWSRLSRSDNLWILLLFAFSTIHWYMAIAGKVWYISRILTVTFFSLAALLAFKKKSPLLVGAALGIAMTARPNIVLLWPFLLGIYAQHLQQSGGLRFSRLFKWSMLTAIPIGLCVGGLLWYNYIRFGNFLDFGYATMNVGQNTATVQTFGQFHPAFILYNLKYMFVSLPKWSESCGGKFIPDPQGISIFLTTPALFYLWKSFKKEIWIAGAWLAVLLQVGLLLMHTGSAWEFGYRFIMDFMIPLIPLLAVAAGRRVSWLFKVLIFLGIAVNYIGVLWYFGVWCPA